MAWVYQMSEAGSPFERKSISWDELGHQDVEIEVLTCGLCHSDVSMADNEWGMTTYPFVGGHEVVGRVAALGNQVTHLKLGQKVGLGWFSGSCMTCHLCMSGEHHLCGQAQSTIVGRPGGFAERVRCHYSWAIPLPDDLDLRSSGPLFCGGITVFNPIVLNGVQPTDHVGVVGIGGLGHLAIQFLNKWGCDVTAFTSTQSKAEEAKKFGAHRIVHSRKEAELEAMAGSLDFLLVTVNVTLNWPLYLNTLGPNGRLHVVGAVLEPMAIPAFSLIGGQKSVAGSPLGSPALVSTMLSFCARHDIKPQIQTFPMDRINDAFAHLRRGDARYRLVLTNEG